MIGAWDLVFLGDSAVQLRPPIVDPQAANTAVHALARCIRAADVAGVRDVVPGMRDLVVHVDPLRCDLDRLAALVAAHDATDEPAGADGPIIDVPVVYGGDAGPDLGEVAKRCGLSEAEVCLRHAAPLYRVCFVGFLPGFPYLGLVDASLRLPRRETPRPRVPAGAVAIAGEYTGIYPWSSPGGWHLIGRTAIELFDVQQEPPTRFAPGARVRFLPA